MTHTNLKNRLNQMIVNVLLITSLFVACVPFAQAQPPQDKSSSPLPPPTLPDVIRRKLEACNPQAMQKVASLEAQAARLNQQSMYASADAQIAQYKADNANSSAQDALRNVEFYKQQSEPYWRQEAQKYAPGSPERAQCDERIQNAAQKARENQERVERLRQEASETSREAREKRAEADRLRQQAEQLSDQARQMIAKVFDSCEKPAGGAVPKSPVNQAPGSQPFIQPAPNPAPTEQFNQGDKNEPDIKDPADGKALDDDKNREGDREETQPIEPEKKKKSSWKKSLLKNGLLIGGGVATGILIGKTGGHHRSDSEEHVREIQTQQTECKKPKH
jgi:hypothetical protein